MMDSPAHLQVQQHIAQEQFALAAEGLSRLSPDEQTALLDSLPEAQAGAAGPTVSERARVQWA
jgi:hypothetical protein